MKFTPSINIENGIDDNFHYIVTPNSQQVLGTILSGFHSGIHSFTIIGTYGTGKSSFILALERDLIEKTDFLFPNKGQFNGYTDFEILNLVGDYTSLIRLFCKKLNCEENTFFSSFDKYYKQIQEDNKFLVVVVDEFGKILEHAANNNPEKELYFVQKFAEYANNSTKNILFLTTLHQNFGTYARKLTEEQRNEWTKVKGRFAEVVFSEPVEQLLFLASKQLSENQKNVIDEKNFETIFNIAKETKFISNTLIFDDAIKLYPIDIFSAFVLTLAIQRYGQNERSLFSFLNSKGNYSLENAEIKVTKTYNLSNIYDYITYNFYAYLSEVNSDSMAWSAMRVALERVESLIVDEHIRDASKLIKTIGLLNLFSSSSVCIEKEKLYLYAENALDIQNPKLILDALENFKIIRYARYKKQYILFYGTDVNIEDELLKATAYIPQPSADVDEIKKYFEYKITPAISVYYEKGTPRYFEYVISNEAKELIPIGDTDGFINLIFPQSTKYTKENVFDISVQTNQAIIYAYFANTDSIIKHLHEINKLKYVLDVVLVDKSDKVAITEINNILSFEKALLNKAINENLISYSNNVIWVYKGEIEQIQNQSDFNKLISRVCADVYSTTPIMRNELFNRQKLSSAIATAKGGYIQALLDNENKKDIGFQQDKFPPEKTIYYSLLKNTGIHREDNNGNYMLGEPTSSDLKDLWNVCEDFLQSTVEKKRKLGELIKILQTAPIKLKQGFIDFWLPTYLLIRKQDFSLFDSRDLYVPDINREVLDILPKSPNEYSIKKFSIDGVKLDFFNQYRQFVNLKDEEIITSNSFIETIKPFIVFYKRLNNYAQHTCKFDNPKTVKFRDALADAKDPEKIFFEDLPNVLGFKNLEERNDVFLSQYQDLISSAITDLRLCYDNLIERIEKKVIADLGVRSNDFQEYIGEIQNRYQHIKRYLLTQKQQAFLNRLLSPSDSKKTWYQSICYVVLNKSLDNLRDEEEVLLIDNLIFLFREIEKYIEISKIVDKNSNDEVFKFEMVSTNGTISPQAYRLPETQKSNAEILENKITKILSGDTNLDICTLLKILNDKLKQENNG